LAQNFNPDFTFFIYKEKKGFWPGLITQLKPEKNLIVLKPEIAKLENSTNLERLFITKPEGEKGLFRDVLLSGQPARVLDFSVSSPAKFIYGWFHNYLVISTSEVGLKEAIGRL
jgi:hypothetical protein